MNESNQPPLPQPSGQTCPNCGAAQSAGAQYCSHCGSRMVPIAGSGLPVVLRIVLSIFLALTSLALGAFAACLPVMDSIGSGEQKTSPEAILMMGVAVLMAFGCIWAIFRINRKP